MRFDERSSDLCVIDHGAYLHGVSDFQTSIVTIDPVVGSASLGIVLATNYKGTSDVARNDHSRPTSCFSCITE